MPDTLLADLEAGYPREAVRLSQPALERVMEATRPADTTLRHRRITITLRMPVSPPSPVVIEHDSVQLGHADNNDAAEIANHYGDRLRKGVQTSAVMFRGDDQWRLRYDIMADPVSRSGESIAVSPSAAVSPSIAESVRQIQRWVGWLVALVAIYMAVTLLFGFYAGFATDPQPQPVILQYPDVGG